MDCITSRQVRFQHCCQEVHDPFCFLYYYQLHYLDLIINISSGSVPIDCGFRKALVVSFMVGEEAKFSSSILTLVVNNQMHQNEERIQPGRQIMQVADSVNRRVYLIFKFLFQRRFVLFRKGRMR